MSTEKRRPMVQFPVRSLLLIMVGAFAVISVAVYCVRAAQIGYFGAWVAYLVFVPLLIGLISGLIVGAAAVLGRRIVERGPILVQALVAGLASGVVGYGLFLLMWSQFLRLELRPDAPLWAAAAIAAVGGISVSFLASRPSRRRV